MGCLLSGASSLLFVLSQLSMGFASHVFAGRGQKRGEVGAGEEFSSYFLNLVFAEEDSKPHFPGD